MERVTQKHLQSLVDKVNAKRKTSIIIFPNMYGYGISEQNREATGRYKNYFSGKARECEAFLLGLLCEPIIKQ